MTLDIQDANCKDSQEAYRLAFSPHITEMNLMIAKYCYDCPIQAACLLEGIRTESYGVWGGRTRKFREDNLSFMRPRLLASQAS